MTYPKEDTEVGRKYRRTKGNFLYGHKEQGEETPRMSRHRVIPWLNYFILKVRTNQTKIHYVYFLTLTKHQSKFPFPFPPFFFHPVHIMDPLQRKSRRIISKSKILTPLLPYGIMKPWIHRTLKLKPPKITNNQYTENVYGP